MSNYWKNIVQGSITMLEGLQLTFKHLFYATRRRKPLSVESPNYFDQQNGLVTALYPHETIPVPDHGRYRLYNEIDDCIVCDLCAKICPVNCIEIDAIKSTEEIGKTSDGSAKRLYAGKFDIDMAKCCFCGLCTTVCPTECLTMTKTYDFPEFDILNMNYHFTNLSPEEAEEKRGLYEESQRIKAELKKQKDQTKSEEKLPEQSASGTKPVFKPATKPTVKPVQQSTPKDAATEKTAPEASGQAPDVPPSKPSVKPIIRPVTGTKKSNLPASDNQAASSEESSKEHSQSKKPVVGKPVIRPVVKPAITKTESQASENTDTDKIKPENQGNDPQPAASKQPKPLIKPVIKPAVPKSETDADKNSDRPVEDKSALPKSNLSKPVIKPIIRPVVPKKADEDVPADNSTTSTPSPQDVKELSDTETKQNVKTGNAPDNESTDEVKNVNPKPVKPVIKPIVKPVIKPKKDNEDSKE